jgi:hypothetical protein
MENTAKKVSHLQDSKTASPVDPIERDWLLQRLVGMVNASSQEGDAGLSLSLTILSGGAVLTGRLISYREYFKRLGENFASSLKGGKPDHLDKVAKLFNDLGGLVETKARAHAEETSREFPMHYIHLADARVVHPNGMIPTEAPDRSLSLWRARIASVDAFIFGEINSSN